ncbi:chitin-binding protein [Pseudonocardiaceae bacterium YIM PH 21723]|nr:chitin-binding protein [Pseudonocardiaceae bacterium YIM PH 21723]
MSRKITALVVGALLSPLISVVTASGASAHGFVSDPPSRQAQCAAGTVSCGDIKAEPDNVRGPKGQATCNAGDARWADLNDDGKDWTVTPVGQQATFTWTITPGAQHPTANWEYWIDGTRIADFEYGGAQPPVTLAHTVSLAGRTGPQKILAVWNESAADIAYYSCIDVNVSR